MGEVVEVGSAITTPRPGDRVVVPFTISCGTCFFCQQGLFALCDTSNLNAEVARKAMGHPGWSVWLFAHAGGFAGGQAEYLRVPFADVGPLKIPSGLCDEQVLFLSDIFPTGYMAAENAEIAPGDTVAVWGCGPAGQFTMQSAWMLGAGRVIAIDRVPERLHMAATHGKAETITLQEDVYDRLMEMTKAAAPTAALTQSARKRMPAAASMRCSTRRRRQVPRHRPAARAARGDRAAVRAAHSRSPASILGSSTRSRSARR